MIEAHGTGTARRSDRVEALSAVFAGVDPPITGACSGGEGQHRSPQGARASRRAQAVWHCGTAGATARAFRDAESAHLNCGTRPLSFRRRCSPGRQAVPALRRGQLVRMVGTNAHVIIGEAHHRPAHAPADGEADTSSPSRPAARRRGSRGGGLPITARAPDRRVVAQTCATASLRRSHHDIASQSSDAILAISSQGSAHSSGRRTTRRRRGERVEHTTRARVRLRAKARNAGDGPPTLATEAAFRDAIAAWCAFVPPYVDWSPSTN